MSVYPGVISYPIPLYQNLPINAQYYQPSRFVINAVTLGINTLIQTIENMNYVIGQEVRLIIPPTFGCRQLNEKKGFVISIPNPNQVLVSINSSKNVNAFINSSDPINSPQILAIGDVNTGATNFHGLRHQLTFIPGSFRDISPN